MAGGGALARRVVSRSAKASLPVCAVGLDVEHHDALRAAGAVVVYGDPAAPDVLKAAQVDRARVLVVAESDLADKMRVCVAARELNPRLVLVATAASAHERAWLAEFGVAQVCDATDEQAASVVRAIREAL